MQSASPDLGRCPQSCGIAVQFDERPRGPAALPRSYLGKRVRRGWGRWTERTGERLSGSGLSPSAGDGLGGRSESLVHLRDRTSHRCRRAACKPGRRNDGPGIPGDARPDRSGHRSSPGGAGWRSAVVRIPLPRALVRRPHRSLPGPDGAVVGCVGAAVDITARRAAEARVALNEARLAEAQRTAHVGSFEWEIGSNLVTWTDELHRIYGLEPGQFDGTVEAFLARVYPDDLDLTRRVVGEACRKAGPFSYDHRIVRADGSVRSLHTRGEVFADAGGRAGPAGRILLGCHRADRGDKKPGAIAVAASGHHRGDHRRDLVVDQRPQGGAAQPALPRPVEDPARAGGLPGRRATCSAHVRSQLESPDEFVREVEEIYAHPGIGEHGAGSLQRRPDLRTLFGAPANRGCRGGQSLELPRRLRARAAAAQRAVSLGRDAACSPRWRSSRRWTAWRGSPFLTWVTGAPSTCSARAGRGAWWPSPEIRRTPISPELHPSVLAGQSLIYQVGPISYLGVPLLMKDSLAGAITFCAAAHRRYHAARRRGRGGAGPPRRPRAGQRAALPTSAGGAARPRRVSLGGGARDSRPGHGDSPRGAGDPEGEGPA